MRKTVNLNTGWLVATDENNTGKASGMSQNIPTSAKPVPVPGIMQQAFPNYHGVAWYYLTVTKELFLHPTDTEHLVLHFGAVDYFSEIYVDGTKVGENEGAENEFSIDVTGILKENSLIAVRVINPKDGDPIDGFEMKTIPHRNKADGGYRPGECYNSGGLVLPVTLMLQSALRVSDCFVRADWKTGELDLEVELTNKLDTQVNALLNIAVRSTDSHQNCLEKTTVLSVAPGTTVMHIKSVIPDFKLWDIDNPNLYEITLTAESDANDDSESFTTHFGFRDFRLVNGYFYLNGRRIFLKSAHTGNHMPEGLSVTAASMPELEYKDLQLSKAAGYNCIRFIATQATPRQLDYCDRLGLMVYQETYASWCLYDSPEARNRYNASILAEVRRDRNHPSLTIWGLLNETMLRNAAEAHYAARDILPRLRELDNTRLVIFSSGRFDLRESLYPEEMHYVPDVSLGSAANPESSVWENVWGNDGDTDLDMHSAQANECYRWSGYRFYAGDVHRYYGYPHSPEVIEFLRTYGHNTRPVFISEFGVGSHLNVIENCLEFERAGTAPTSPDYSLMASIRDRYLKDYYRFGFDNTYVDPVDHLRDSEKYNAQIRRDEFDLVRSNPQFVGFNMTGLLDHAICGEGPYTFFRRVKPLNFDALQEGWAPLRWCLFFHVDGNVNTGCNIYPDTPIELEAVLADEDRLAPGKHSAVFAVVDETGTPCFRAETDFITPDADEHGIRPLSYPVFRQTVTLSVKPGKYIFRAYLKDGGCAVASEKEFFITARPTEKIDRKIALLGLPDCVRDAVTALGAQIAEPEQAEVVLVGSVDTETGKKAISYAEHGAHVAFIDPNFLLSPEFSTFVPLPDYSAIQEHYWLYHPEGAVRVDALTDGMKTGFLDWNWYYGACPVVGYQTSRTPDTVGAAHFYVGGPGEYHSSLALSAFNCEKGELILSAFPICSALGKAPAADQLLINLLKR